MLILRISDARAIPILYAKNARYAHGHDVPSLIVAMRCKLIIATQNFFLLRSS